MEWVPIRTTDDIAVLMEAYAGFHDSCIVSAQYVSGASVDERFAMHGKDPDCVLVLAFESQMASFFKPPSMKTLELRFIGLRRLNLAGYEDRYFCEIQSCYLDFHQDRILWADSDDFDAEATEGTPLHREPMTTFVLADRLEWRFPG